MMREREREREGKIIQFNIRNDSFEVARERERGGRKRRENRICRVENEKVKRRYNLSTKKMFRVRKVVSSCSGNICAFHQKQQNKQMEGKDKEKERIFLSEREREREEEVKGRKIEKER